jgi:flagellar biosynthesis component FlhA
MTDLVPVTLKLAPPLLEAVGPAADTSDRIARELGELVDELGLDLEPQLHIASDATKLTTRPIELEVAGRPCPFPQMLVAEALAYVDGTHRSATDSDATLAGLAGGPADRAVELLATVTRTALSAQPTLLVDSSRVRAEAADAIDIEIDFQYLRSVSSDETQPGPFALARDGLFAELGLPLPPFHFRPDPSLRAGGFAIRIGGVRSLPRIGLPSDTILVNETADRLAGFQVDAEPTLNVATHHEESLAPREAKDILEQYGFTTWNALEYLILCLAAAVRSNAHALMTPDTATTMVEQLSPTFPFLTAAAERDLPRDALADILSDLLLDGVPIRDLRRIVELLLRYETDDATSFVGDRTAFVRSGFADTIAHTCARGTSTVVVYLLDPEIEVAVAASDDTQDRLAAALHAELAEIPNITPPALLTRDDLRRPIRELVHNEFPHVRVLGYGDLPPDYNVQPVARLGLP